MKNISIIKRYGKGFLILLGFIMMVHQAGAQNITQPALAATMESIYKNYDSIPFLSFDVRYNYTSDTLLGDYTNEQLEGSYTMAGKKAKYRLGDIDFMQNESFFIAVYNSDKMILVDVPKTNNSGNNLPMRQMMDSLVQAYATNYNINRNFVNTDTGVISFDRTDTITELKRFSITYDDRNKMILKIAYEYLEPVQPDSNINITLPANRKRRLSIEFSNYRFDNYDAAVYNENNYIYFERGVCKPVAKYEDYTIYNSKPAANIVQNP